MTRSEQKAATRETLIDHARGQFAEHGYDAVSIPDVVAAAGVTKGALYHQFAGKSDLFEAVLARAHAEVGDAVASAADAAPDPWSALLAGCRAFLLASTEPSVRRIMLLDGPSVLGWERWRQIDDEASASHLQEALSGLVDGGVLAPQPVAPITRLLSGAMNEAALWLARPDAQPDDLDDAMAALTLMLGALRS